MRVFSSLFLLLAAITLLILSCAAAILISATLYLLALFLPAQSDTAAGIDFARAMIVIISATFGVALVLSLIFTRFIAAQWTRPQRRLYAASVQVADGNFNADFTEGGPIETALTMRNLGRIARSFDRVETARRSFLVGIAQELQAPVRAVCDRLAELHQLGRDVAQDELLSISDKVQRLVEMADDLHAVALADLGRLPVTFGPVDPCALIHNAMWANRRRAEAAGVQLTTAALPTSTIIVKWDGPRIEQLFTALIDNSLHYTPKGGEIVLGLEGSRNAWRLIIDDSAPGIDVDLAQRLFEPFYRTAYGAGETGTSSGLGLATAQAIVEAHHGRIEAGVSPLGGLRVTVILPGSPPTV
ncbi:MAG: ATP-binding protein [Sphingomonas sp.]